MASNNNPVLNPRFLRLQSVLKISGISRSTLYSLIWQGLWTKQVKLSKRASSWPEHEVSAINSARLAGKSDAEIRELVRSLEAARKSLA